MLLCTDVIMFVFVCVCVDLIVSVWSVGLLMLFVCILDV